jgi:hypothetical protein
MSQNIKKLEGSFIMNGHFQPRSAWETSPSELYFSVRTVGKGVGEKVAVKVILDEELGLQATSVGGHRLSVVQVNCQGNLLRNVEW